MRTLFNIISAKPLFFIIIGLSLLTGVIYYAVSVIKTKKAVRKIIIFICSGILAMLVTVAVCNYIALLLSTEKFTYKPVFSIFYAFCFFPPIAFIFQKALRIETDFEPYVTPIMLSIPMNDKSTIRTVCRHLIQLMRILPGQVYFSEPYCIQSR